jgi:hypothetical protein
MKRFNSTIVQKRCKCSPECDKYPTLGYKGYFIHHFPGEIKKQYKNSRAQLSKISRELHKVTREKTKSDYLKIADILFGNWIKKRDSDSNKFITCVCCNGTFNLKDKDASGNYIVQCMHFVPRGTYSLRFDEINCHAGCSYCNLDMHLNPEGLAYKRYRRYLVESLGEDHVKEMEEQKRNINKLTESELRIIIEKYKNKKL